MRQRIYGSSAKCGIMSSLHQGFQERGPSADTEATFRWLDRVDEHPLAHQLKRRMLDVCPVRAGIRCWTWDVASGMRSVASPGGWGRRGGSWGSTPTRP